MHPTTPTQLSTAQIEAIQRAVDPVGHLGREVNGSPWHLYQTGIEQEAWPTLHLEDVSGIPFLTHIAGLEQYQHRARARAGAGDLFAAVVPPADGYETYCRDMLGLGETVCVIAEPVAAQIEVARACAHGDAFETICQHATARGGLTIHPYMGIEPVWQLAQAVQAATNTPARVLAPVPDALWLANDKAALDRLVRALGREANLASTRTAHNAVELAHAMRAAAAEHPLIGVKRTRCASAMGNAVFTRAQITGQPVEDTLREAEAFLTFTEWDGAEEVLVVEWIDTELSPSTQLWIPPLGQGSPRLDGVYEQLLSGAERVFVGSRPSLLPAPVERELAQISLEICAAFQHLGYVGRCSFDFVIGGDPEGDFRVVLTECNGRWGGTSTPMHLVDRLVPGPRPAYIARDVIFDHLIGATFLDVLDRLRATQTLYDPTTGQGHYLLYNVGPIPTRGKFDVIALGTSPEHAAELMNELLPKVLA